MPKIKYFINKRDPEALGLAKELENAGIHFERSNTSGPTTLLCEGQPHYGLTSVKYAVHKIVGATARTKPLKK